MIKGLSRLRRVAFVATAIASSAALVTSASAAGANFKSASASVNGSGQLVVSFVEVGAGANQALTVRADAQARATYACLNGSGKSATAANKQDVVGAVGASGSFTADRYGKVTGTITVSPPASPLSCPGGQTLVLAAVTYSSVSVLDVANNSSRAISGTFSRTFYVV